MPTNWDDIYNPGMGKVSKKPISKAHEHFCECGKRAVVSSHGSAAKHTWINGLGNLVSGFVCFDEARKLPFCNKCSPSLWNALSAIRYPEKRTLNGEVWAFPNITGTYCNALFDHIECVSKMQKCSVCPNGRIPPGGRCFWCESFSREDKRVCVFCKETPQRVVFSLASRPMCDPCTKLVGCQCNSCVHLGINVAARNYWRAIALWERHGGEKPAKYFINN